MFSPAGTHQTNTFNIRPQTNCNTYVRKMLVPQLSTGFKITVRLLTSDTELTSLFYISNPASHRVPTECLPTLIDNHFFSSAKIVYTHNFCTFLVNHSIYYQLVKSVSIPSDKMTFRRSALFKLE